MQAKPNLQAFAHGIHRSRHSQCPSCHHRRCRHPCRQRAVIPDVVAVFVSILFCSTVAARYHQNRNRCPATSTSSPCPYNPIIHRRRHGWNHQQIDQVRFTSTTLRLKSYVSHAKPSDLNPNPSNTNPQSPTALKPLTLRGAFSIVVHSRGSSSTRVRRVCSDPSRRCQLRGSS